jgi:hypothetical protein
MYTFHLENGTAMPLLVKAMLVDSAQDKAVFEQVVAGSSEEVRWNYGQNPSFHQQHYQPQLNFMVWSVSQPHAPPLLFTMDARKTNHLTLLCRQAFVEQCSPTTMIFVGKQIQAWNVAT